MAGSSSSSSSGIGFLGLLAIVFITLKLIGQIDWSWWWVLSPLWIPVGVLAAFGAGVILAALSIELLKLIVRMRRRFRKEGR